MTPETEERLLEDIGELRQFMRHSVSLRESDIAQRKERQIKVDERYAELRADIKVVQKQMGEWKLIEKGLKWVGGAVVLLATIKLGDIPGRLVDLFHK